MNRNERIIEMTRLTRELEKLLDRKHLPHEDVHKVRKTFHKLASEPITDQAIEQAKALLKNVECVSAHTQACDDPELF